MPSPECVPPYVFSKEAESQTHQVKLCLFLRTEAFRHLQFTSPSVFLEICGLLAIVFSEYQTLNQRRFAENLNYQKMQSA